jgi:5-methylcytosine-specific restriction endonuclease McrA
MAKDKPRENVAKETKRKPRYCFVKTLKQLQCDNNNGQSYCEKCGDFIDVELHHTILVSENPKEAINPATHMLLCAGCHTNLHAECR